MFIKGTRATKNGDPDVVTKHTIYLVIVTAVVGAGWLSSCGGGLVWSWGQHEGEQ